MTERLGEIAARIEGVRKLGAVMGAMRGIASARVRRAEAELRAVDSYEETVRDALARVTAMAPTPEAADAGEPGTLVVFLAEQGFAGAFSERVLDRVEPGPRLVLVGARGAALAAERGIAPWRVHALPSRGGAAPRFADDLARELLAAGSRRIDALFTAPNGGETEIHHRRLLPVPALASARNEPDRPSFLPPPPVLNLPRAELLADLMAEALHAGLCRAAITTLAAENAARMLAMTAAQNQTERKLEELTALERRVRQETITSEIIELAAGEAASRARRRRRRVKDRPTA